MLAVENGLEQTGVIGTNRSQSPIPSPQLLHRMVNSVQQSVGGRFQADHRKGIQIALVGCPAQFHSASYVGDTFAHGQPLFNSLAAGDTAAVYFETAGVINRGLDPQHAALLVVHFDRVLFHPMFHSDAFNAPLQIAAGLARETLVSAALQKPHYFLTAKLKHGMAQQQRIDLGQLGGATKHDVGGIFSLTHAPVVAPNIQSGPRMDPGVHLLRQGIEKTSPIALRQSIHQLLRSLQVRNVGKAIVSLGVTNPGPVQLARQPLTSVKTDLNSERQPSLQPDMHQAKLAVQNSRSKDADTYVPSRSAANASTLYLSSNQTTGRVRRRQTPPPVLV